MLVGGRLCFADSVILKLLLPPLSRFLILFSLALGLVNELSDSRSEALSSGFELSSKSLPETKASDESSFMLAALVDTSSDVSNLLEDLSWECLFFLPFFFFGWWLSLLVLLLSIPDLLSPLLFFPPLLLLLPSWCWKRLFLLVICPTHTLALPWLLVWDCPCDCEANPKEPALLRLLPQLMMLPLWWCFFCFLLRCLLLPFLEIFLADDWCFRPCSALTGGFSGGVCWAGTSGGDIVSGGESDNESFWRSLGGLCLEIRSSSAPLSYKSVWSCRFK